mgnify:CR=1 FL=1
MIERHHYLKLRSNLAHPEARAEVVRRVLETLPGLPGVTGVSAGVPADAEAERSWDVVITVRFADLSDIAAYRADPIHRRFVDEFLAPRVEVKKAWNFEVASTGSHP